MDVNRSGRSSLTLDDIIAAAENPDKSVGKAEDEIDEQLQTVAEKIISGGYKLILLAGPTSSGKTTASELLTERLRQLGKHCLPISMDHFYLDRERVPLLPNGSRDIESIRGYDVELINRVLTELAATRPVEMPVFDFLTERRSEQTRLLVPESEGVVIFEGINALNPEIACEFDPQTVCHLYISVQTDILDDNDELLSGQDIRFLRRLVRDYHNRGASPEKTLGMWAGVCEGERLYIQPYQHTVDLQINTFHSYELSVLKSTANPLLPREGASQDDLLDRIGYVFSQIPELPASVVPCDSILAEFVGCKKMKP